MPNLYPDERETIAAERAAERRITPAAERAARADEVLSRYYCCDPSYETGGRDHSLGCPG